MVATKSMWQSAAPRPDPIARPRAQKRLRLAARTRPPTAPATRRIGLRPGILIRYAAAATLPAATAAAAPATTRWIGVRSGILVGRTTATLSAATAAATTPGWISIRAGIAVGCAAAAALPAAAATTAGGICIRPGICVGRATAAATLATTPASSRIGIRSAVGVRRAAAATASTATPGRISVGALVGICCATAAAAATSTARRVCVRSAILICDAATAAASTTATTTASRIFARPRIGVGHALGGRAADAGNRGQCTGRSTANHTQRVAPIHSRRGHDVFIAQRRYGFLCVRFFLAHAPTCTPFIRRSVAGRPASEEPPCQVGRAGSGIRQHLAPHEPAFINQFTRALTDHKR